MSEKEGRGRSAWLRTRWDCLEALPKEKTMGGMACAIEPDRKY